MLYSVDGTVEGSQSQRLNVHSGNVPQQLKERKTLISSLDKDFRGQEVLEDFYKFSGSSLSVI